MNRKRWIAILPMCVLISPRIWMVWLLAGLCLGCGTTRRSDTARTATEQMLLSDAVDRAISRIDFGLMAGKEVYLDSTYLGSAVDKEYIISTLRQHMLACGCLLKDKKEEASLVVEVRSGVVGTDRHDLLFGTPATTVSLGALAPLPGTPTMMPEIALAKRTDQMGVAKIAVFAYERASGIPVWQSGSDVVASRSRDLWVFGTGPFQRGNIYDGPKFAGDDVRVPLVGGLKNDKRPPVRVARERLFNSQVLAKDDKVKPTGAQTALASSPPAENKSSGAKPTPGPSIGRPLPAAQPMAEKTGVASGTAQEKPAGLAAARPESVRGDAAPRSQFDAIWGSTPLDGQDANATIADRRWPAMSQTR